MSDKKRRPWTTEEDEILRKRIKSYGLNNWGMVADGLPGRSGKSCSERWRIYLTPGVKRPTQEPFNEYEVAVIYLGQQVHGNQWSAIAKLLPGRTNTAIKNLWKTALQSTEAKRVKSNQYIQAGHTLETLLANPPSASEMAAVQRRKAAAAAARRRRQEAAAAAAAAASNATSTGIVSGSGADSSGCGSEEDGTAMSGDECEEGAGASGVSAGHGTTASEVQDVQEDHMQVDGPVAAVDSADVDVIKREQACSPGSAGSESNAPGADAGAAATAAGVTSADRTERCSADGSSHDPQDALNPMSCGVMHAEDYSMLGDVNFCFDEPDNDSPLDSSCDQLGGSAWEMSEQSDLLLPEGEQEAAAAAAAASVGAPEPCAAAPAAGSCGEANSNSSGRGASPVDAPAAAQEVQAPAPAAEQQPNLVPADAAAAAAAATPVLEAADTVAAEPAARPAAAPAAAAPTPAAPRLGGLKPGTGLRVLLPPGSIETVQLPKPQQQQQQAQVPVATPAAAASPAAGMVPVVTPQQQQMLMQQQLSAQQQQQLQAQLMLQAWQQQQQLQMQQQAAAKQQSKAASSSRRAQRRRPARAPVKRSDSESDNDAEIDEAAARAAAEAIASGAIKLNPNVHPAAAAAAAADAARAAARAAARKAASAAAANARKKNKAAAGTGTEPERKMARAAAASDADEDEQEGGVSRQGRQKRRAAAGIAKVVAAEADEATHLGLSPVDTSAQDLQDPAAAAAMEVDVMQYSMGGPGCGSGAPDAAAAAAAVAGAHSEYTMSYTPVYNSSMGHAGQAAGQMSGAVAGAGAQEWVVSQQASMPPAAAPAHAGPAAPAGAASMAPCPVSGENMMHQFSDDPIMMELFKHELSVAHALQQAPTSSAGPATTPTAAGAASAAAAVSPSFQQGQQQLQQRVSIGSGVVGSPQEAPGPMNNAGMAPLVTVGSSAAALPSPAAGMSTAAGTSGGAGTVVDPAEAAATPRGGESAIPAGSAAAPGPQTMTMGGSEVSAATAAGGMSAAPMQIQRQLSLAVPGTPAGAACSAADSEGSVFTASSRNSCTITSNLRGTAARLPSAFVPQGQHAAGGYYVTFTAPNGTRQQVLVQPAGGVPAAAPNSSGNYSGVPMQQQQQQMMMNMPVMSMPAPTSSMGMPASMGMGMMPMGSSAPGAVPAGSCAMYSQQHMGAGQQQHQGQHQQQHSNPVLAAMLSSDSDMSAHNPVLHATMAALSNQGSCNCVYCLTSGGRQQGMCRPQQGSGCVMGSAGAGTASGANSEAAGHQAPTPAQLASWAMPPPRPVLLPQHPLAGKQAAAAAAAITAAAVGAGVGVPAGMTADMAGPSTGQGFDLVTMGANGMGMGSVTAGMAPQLPVSMSAAAAEKAAEAAAAAAAAVGGLVGSDDEEHDWGFDVVDLDGLDVTF